MFQFPHVIRHSLFQVMIPIIVAFEHVYPILEMDPQGPPRKKAKRNGTRRRMQFDPRLRLLARCRTFKTLLNSQAQHIHSGGILDSTLRLQGWVVRAFFLLTLRKLCMHFLLRCELAKQRAPLLFSLQICSLRRPTRFAYIFQSRPQGRW